RLARDARQGRLEGNVALDHTRQRHRRPDCQAAAENRFRSPGQADSHDSRHRLHVERAGTMTLRSPSWWRQRSVRTTLTIWYAAATFAVLSAYAAAVYAVVRHDALSTLDERLSGDFQWAHEMVEQRPDGSFAWFDGDNGEGAPWLQVWTEGGDLLYRSVLAERIPIRESASMASRHEQGIRSLTAAANVRLRMLGREAAIGDVPVTIQV